MCYLICGTLQQFACVLAVGYVMIAGLYSTYDDVKTCVRPQ